MNSGLANSSIPDIDFADCIHNIANFVLVDYNCITGSSAQGSCSYFANSFGYSDFQRFEMIGIDYSSSFDYCITANNLRFLCTDRHSFGYILVKFHILRLRVAHNFDPHFDIHNCYSCFGSIGFDSFANHNSTNYATANHRTTDYATVDHSSIDYFAVDHGSIDFSFVVIVHIADFTVHLDCILVAQSCCYFAW